MAEARKDTKVATADEAKTPDPAGAGVNPAGLSPDEQRKATVPGLVADPQPGDLKPGMTGLEVNVDAHEEEHVPVMGYVSHQIMGTSGPINVHTPGLILVKQEKHEVVSSVDAQEEADKAKAERDEARFRARRAGNAPSKHIQAKVEPARGGTKPAR